jgi:sulfide:quinone oxidoreductase
MLFTGASPRYLRHTPTDSGEVSGQAPWWPPHKIAGRELAPYLAAHPELQLDPAHTRA